MATIRNNLASIRRRFDKSSNDDRPWWAYGCDTSKMERPIEEVRKTQVWKDWTTYLEKTGRGMIDDLHMSEEIARRLHWPRWLVYRILMCEWAVQRDIGCSK